MLWQSLANDVRLGEEVVDIQLEVISQDQDKPVVSASSHKVLGTASTLTVMLETHTLEEVARVELCRVVFTLASC